MSEGNYKLPHPNTSEGDYIFNLIPIELDEEDEKLKLSLRNVVKWRRNKRKSIRGKYPSVLLVFLPTGESVFSRRELWGKVKHDKELYNKIVMDAGLEGETEIDFDERAVRVLLSSEFFKELVEETKTEEDIAVERSSKEQHNYLLTVGKLHKVFTQFEDFKYFLKQYEGVQVVKQEVTHCEEKQVLWDSYEVTFKDSNSVVMFFNLAEKRFGKKILSKKQLYTCCYCSSSFDHKYSLRKHIGRLHVKRSYQCHGCPKKFARKDLLENHKLLHNASAHFCITCRKKFKTEKALSKHLYQGMYCSLQCIFCTKTFAKKCNLVKHEKLCYGDEWNLGGSCELCFKAFKYRIDLERHRKCYSNIDGSFKYVCGRCKKNHCSWKMLMDHIHEGYNDDLCNLNKSEICLYPCEKCGKQFESKDQMINHLETHIVRNSRTGTKHNVSKPSETHEYQCKLCQRKFTLYKNYDRHKKLAYDEDGISRYSCTACSSSFCTSRLLKRHCNESHSVSCVTCDETFTTKRALYHHIRKRESFTCEECKKTFCNKNAFRLHMSCEHLVKV